MRKTEKQRAVKSTVFASKCFNARLFFEGIKRLKVILLGIAILALTVSLLIPIISWVNYADRYNESCWVDVPVYDDEGSVMDVELEFVEQEIVPDKIEGFLLCLPLYGLPFIAPFFFFVLFSFLHKRKQSDFFHAIPYTRTCVFVSFSTAALASVAAIAILSALLSGLLYAACPFTTFSIGNLFSIVGISILSAAFLSSFMMLSLSLTGTPSTTVLLFGLFASITRIVLALFSYAVSTFTIVQPGFFPFLSINWYLPFRMFVQSNTYMAGIPSYGKLVPYTVIVTLLVFAAAGLFYKLRPSEMAERSAPSRILQSVFRCLFTLPFALLLTTMIMIDEIDFDVALVLFVVTLLVFYLYELITTKRAKNLIRATPWLGAVAGGAAVFVLSFAIFGAAVHADIPAEKIESVSITPSHTTSFESLNSAVVPTEDERVIELVAYAVDYTRNYNRGYNYIGKVNYRTVTIRKTNGMTVKRGLYFTEDNEALLESYLEESREYVDSFLAFPPLESIRGLHFSPEGVEFYDSLYFSGNTKRLEEFYEILKSEYDALTVEEKLAFKRGYYVPEEKPDRSDLPDFVYGGDHYMPFTCRITINGNHKGNSYSSYYTVPDKMQKTISYAFTKLAEEYSTCLYQSDYLYKTYGISRLSSHRGEHTPIEVSSAIFRDLAGGHISFKEGTIRFAAHGDHEYTLGVTKEGADFTPFYEKISALLESSSKPKADTVPVFLLTNLCNLDELNEQAFLTVTLFLTEEEYKDLLASIGVVGE